MPAIDWVAMVPERIDRVRVTLAPLLDLYNNLEKFIDKTVSQIAASTEGRGSEVRIATPNSMLGIITASAPHAAIQLFFALLVIYFFLSGTSMRRARSIAGHFEGAMTTARYTEVVKRLDIHGKITVINVPGRDDGDLWMWE